MNLFSAKIYLADCYVRKAPSDLPVVKETKLTDKQLKAKETHENRVGKSPDARGKRDHFERSATVDLKAGLRTINDPTRKKVKEPEKASKGSVDSNLVLPENILSSPEVVDSVLEKVDGFIESELGSKIETTEVSAVEAENIMRQGSSKANSKSSTKSEKNTKRKVSVMIMPDDEVILVEDEDSNSRSPLSRSSYSSPTSKSSYTSPVDKAFSENIKLQDDKPFNARWAVSDRARKLLLGPNYTSESASPIKRRDPNLESPDENNYDNM